MKRLKPHSIRLLLCVMLGASLAVGQMRSHKLGVGFSGAGYQFLSDYANTNIGVGGGVNLSYSAWEHIGLRMMLGSGQLSWTNAGQGYTTNMYSGNFYVSYDLIPHGNFNPFLFAGMGAIYFDPHSDKGVYITPPSKMDINYLGGVGFDYFFSEFFSVTVSAENAMTNTDWLDGLKGGANDGYRRVNVEFRYYFFDQDYVTKLIKALQDRMKK